MYAVIRAGGKQYRVAPGDVLRLETQSAQDGKVEFGDVLAVSASEGHIARPIGCLGDRRSSGRRPRQKNYRLPLQAQETIQETGGTSAAVQLGANYGDRFRWPEVHCA